MSIMVLITFSFRAQTNRQTDKQTDVTKRHTPHGGRWLYSRHG